MAHQLISSLNAGELSPYLDARSDLEKYTAGCRMLENFIILPYGGAFRRPGTEYLGAARYATTRCRLIGFNFTTSTRFVLEMGNKYLRFWSQDGIQVNVPSDSDWQDDHVWVEGFAYAPGDYVYLPDSGNTYLCLSPHTSSGVFDDDVSVGFWVLQSFLEVPTPYAEADLRDVQYVQINDVMYFVHPSHAPRKLTRVADDNWTFAEVGWDFPALLDENITNFCFKPGATTGSTTLTVVDIAGKKWVKATNYKKNDYITDTATDILYQVQADYHSGDTLADDLTANQLVPYVYFQPEHVGTYFGLAYSRETAFIEQDLSKTKSDTTPPTLTVVGAWALTTYGNWAGTLKLQRSYDGTNWETIRTYKATTSGERNVSSTGKEEKQAKLRLNWERSHASANATARLEAGDNKIYGIVKVKSISHGTKALVDVVRDLFPENTTTPESTKYWAEGAWSDKRGYPRTVTLFQQRVYYGGTSYRPQSIWASRVDDFENLMVATDDASGLFFSLSATEANPIQWILPQTELLIGTSGDEWTLGSGDQNSAITPTNVKATRQSSYGSKYFRALVVNDVTLFVQRQGRKVRELVYSFQQNGWLAADLTMLAEHATKGQILECAFQQQPDTIYWTITGEGQLVGMTYERAQNVVGWHRHTTDGIFESVATIYGENGADEVWVAVQRTINGIPVRYIERMKADYRDVFEAQDKGNWWYLDCAKRTPDDRTKGSLMTDLDHLEGKKVDILADGAVSPAQVVASGEITLQDPAENILAGLPFVSRLQPMKFEMQMQDGTSRGRMKRIHRMTASLLKSLGGEFSSNGVDWNWFYSRSFGDLMDHSPPVFSGDKQVYVAADHGPSADITIRQAQPLPLTVLALVIDLDTYGD